MATPRRLLLISYLFPPAGGIAVQRALSLAKYLPDCGYEIHVLRAYNAAQPVYDPGLLEHIPGSVRVHGAFTPEIPFTIRQKLWHKMRGQGQPAGTAQAAGAAQKPSWWKATAVDMVRWVLCPEPEILWVPFAVRKAWSLVKQFKIDTVLVKAPPFSAFLVGVELKKRAPHLRLISDFRD